MRLAKVAVATLLVVGLPSVALAQDNEIFSLIQRWGHVEYQTSGDQQVSAYKGLTKESRALAEKYPDNAHVLAVEGMIMAADARSQGGISALGLAKESRAALEKSLKLDSNGNEGSAQLTLGELYRVAPGWPIAFGDDDKAGQLFQEAVKIRPDGVDTNFYYARYLEEEKGDRAKAIEYGEKAVNGKAREGRDSDEYLRKDVQKWLDGLKK